MSDSNSNIDAEAGAVEDAKKTVGELLRDTRAQAGLDVADVARATRISQRYLEALEEGRSGDLPGLTYAIGFVRSYAEHLNLDGEEIVRRYKSGAQDAGGKTELVFPKPIPDSGVPGAAVLGIGVILAAVAYGVWYWNSNAVDVEVARVEAVPEHMAEAPTEAAAAPEVTPPEPEAQPAQPPMEQDMTQAQVVEPPADVQESAVSEAAPAAETVLDQAEAAPEESPETVADAGQASAPEATAPAEAAVTAAETAAETAPAALTEPQQASSAAVVAAETAVEDAATPAPPPAEDGPGRIIVRAKSNSWIQVRDEALDRLLFTRLLRAGDEYEVPNRAGLRLMTGNAGALELLVDGKPVPAIGGVGEVRRDVELDPEKLKSGSAVTE